ncbi:MAG: regulatory protein RecX [Thermodesulfobacteriota bacterium]
MNDDPLREKAEQKAYRLLALRAHSERELRGKLARGGFAAPVIAGVIEKCRALGYLDDGAFARQRARELAVSRLAGDRRIAVDLGERGISESLCREAIAEVRREISEEAAAERLLRKKAGGRAIAGMDRREKQRLARSLMGKGFPAGLVIRTLKQTGEDAVHADEGE